MSLSVLSERRTSPRGMLFGTAHRLDPAAPGSGWQTAIRAILILHLLLSPLIFSTKTTEPFEANKVALLLATALIVAALSVMEWLQRPSFRNPVRLFGTDWLSLGLLLFVISAGVSTALSINPLTSWRGDHGSWLGLRTLLAYLVLFAVTRRVCRTTADALGLLAAVAVATAIASVYALVQWLGRDPLTWAEKSLFDGHFRPFSALGNPNYLGAYLALALPLLAELGRRAAVARRWIVLTLVSVTGITAAVVVALTLSRSAWLASAFMSLLLAAGWWRVGYRRLGLALVLTLFVVGVVAIPAVGPERILHFGEGKSRLLIWQTAWQLFLDRPLCGWGTDAFRLAFGTHRPIAYWLEEGSVTPTKAHNELLHLLATQGALGAAAALLLLAGLATAAVRAWRRAGPAQRPLVAAVIASLSAFFVQGLFGFTVTPVGTLFITLAALLAHWGQGTREQELEAEALRRTLSAPFLWLGRIAVVGGAGVLLWIHVLLPLRASIACAEGDALLARAPAAAQVCYERAVQLDATNDHSWMQLCAAVQLLSRGVATTAEWDHYDKQARAAADRAVALLPVDPYPHAMRARWLGERAFLGRGSIKAALDEWDIALSLDPENALLLSEAGRSSLALGERDRGRSQLLHGCALYPRFAPFEARLGTLALAEGHLDEARKRLERSFTLVWPNDRDDWARTRAALAATYLALGDLEQAHIAALFAITEAPPTWATPRLLLAQILERRGRIDKAIAAYQQTLRLDPANAAAQSALIRLQPTSH